MLDFINNLNPWQRLGIFALFLFYLPTIPGFICFLSTYIKYRKLMSDWSKGKTPNCVQDFLVHISSPEDYLISKNKVQQFRELISNDRSAELRLNSDDINNLYTKGVLLNKYAPGKYLYYQIKDNILVEKLLEGPTYLPPEPYTTKTIEHSFNGFKKYYKAIEYNGSSMENERIETSLSRSPFILFILGYGDSPDEFAFKFRETLEYQRALLFLEKIKSVELNDGYLIVRA